MNRKSIFILCTMILTIFIALAVKELITPQHLTIEAMRAQIEESYNGEMLSFVEKSDHFIASFKKEQLIFEVAIDAENGHFSNLTIVQKLSEPPKVANNETLDEANRETLNEPKNNENSITSNDSKNEEKAKTQNKPTNKPEDAEQRPQTVITEQQAITIALKEVPGEVDSIDFKNTTDGGNYLIEIEQEDSDIIVVVHAITGKILIQFDD